MAPPPTLEHELQRVAELQAHLPVSSVVVLGLIALGAVVVPAVWVIARHAATIAHEGAHAVVGSAMGHKITHFKINYKADGETGLGGRPRASILAGIVGYLGPGGFGLIAAKLIQLGHIVAVLWLAIIAVAAMLLLMRWSFGLISVTACGLIIYLIARDTSLRAQVAAAYWIAWFLLLSGVGYVVRHWVKADDAKKLRDRTLLPRVVWASLWLVGSVAALGLGASMLL
jgi:hypothetical protein